MDAVRFFIRDSASASPFIDRLGSCVYIERNASVSGWCDAARRCKNIGGELLMDLAAIRAVNRRILPGCYYIGVTDLLVEAGTSRRGWRFANGSLFPELTNADWAQDLPNSVSLNDDFLTVHLQGLRDRTANEDDAFVCQPIATPNSELMWRTEFLKLGNISPDYCYTDALAATELNCLWLCVQRWECRAALFNSLSRACRMDFADSSVGDAIEKDPNWVKYVKKY